MNSQVYYNISEEYGFVLPIKTKISLPDYYLPWIKLKHNLEMLMSQDQLRNQVNQMEVLSVEDLQTEYQLIYSHSLLSFILSGYVWHKGQKDCPLYIPKSIAIPFTIISDRLGLKPILNHVNMALGNALVTNNELHPLSRSIEIVDTIIDNINWVIFQRETVRVELCFGHVIKALYEIEEGMNNKNPNLIIEAFNRILLALVTAKECLPKFKEMDPDYFHLMMRPYLVGWDPQLFCNSKGLGYQLTEDGDLHYIKCIGASAGQSPSLQLLDALFKIKHAEKNESFLQEMKQYMLRSHRELLEDVWKKINLPQFIQENQDNQLLVNKYNECLASFSLFRTNHMGLVTKTHLQLPVTSIFIINPAKKIAKLQNKSEFLQEKGTGGQDLEKFLKEVRDDVNKHKL